MARARNIKPAFFTSEQVADVCPLGRLFFIGLWTQANFKGNLEWKPRTLKIQIIPWDDCDLDQIAINLDKSGLIRFYSDDDKTYINIPKFLKHQNPHKNERDKGSEIPDYTETARKSLNLKGITINRDKSGSKRERSTSDRADSLFPLPDSLFPLPDSLFPLPDSIKPAGQSKIDYGSLFDKFYNAGLTKTKKVSAKKLFLAILKKQKNPAEFTDKLVDDIKFRFDNFQFGFDNLGPDSYLKNERWTDDRVLKTHPSHVGPNSPRTSNKTADMTISEQLTDRSWAGDFDVSEGLGGGFVGSGGSGDIDQGGCEALEGLGNESGGSGDIDQS